MILALGQNRARNAIVVGIAGGTGSGKTAVTRALAAKYRRVGVLTIGQDSYYRDQSHMSEEERALVNYDKPQAIDHDLLFQHLRRLLAGQNVQKPHYCFATHTRARETELIQLQPIVLVEGLFALWDKRIRALMNLKVYVEADPDIRFIRRLRRDILERGRTVESVVTQYLETVRPMHQTYVEPTKAYADLVLDNNTSLEHAIARIAQAISERYPSHAIEAG